MPTIGSWSPSKASSPLLSHGSWGACAVPPPCWPPFKAGNAESGKTSLGKGGRRSGINPAWERVEGVWGAVLAQRWALCFKSFSGRGGVCALGTSCTEAFQGGDG